MPVVSPLTILTITSVGLADLRSRSFTMGDQSLVSKYLRSCSTAPRRTGPPCRTHSRGRRCPGGPGSASRSASSSSLPSMNLAAKASMFLSRVTSVTLRGLARQALFQPGAAGQLRVLRHRDHNRYQERRSQVRRAVSRLHRSLFPSTAVRRKLLLTWFSALPVIRNAIKTCCRASSPCRSSSRCSRPAQASAHESDDHEWRPAASRSSTSACAAAARAAMIRPAAPPFQCGRRRPPFKGRLQFPFKFVQLVMLHG